MTGQNQQCFDECTFIILGATGDLAKRKLIPAIYKLAADKKLCKFAIVGVSFMKTTVHEMLEPAKNFIGSFDPTIWATIQASSYYHEMDFHNEDSYISLERLLSDVEKTNKLVGNRIFYLATMPEHFEVITKNLASHDIVKRHGDQAWSKIVYEKPFGYDLKSAKKINAAIAKVFHEDQVYRIDHYLGKELVGNIALMRFTNRVFEPLWNSKHIDSVQIILSEDMGVEGRGAFYDSCGALKDVVQNHMLQIVSLIAMESPKTLSAKHIRDAKAHVLKKITIDSVVLGQYEGYRDEKDVKKDSKTETFAALKISIDRRRWKDVPFYLKTGKYLKSKEASIHIKFKMAKCLLDVCPADSNYLTIKIDPNPGFFLELNMKVPGMTNQIAPVKMELGHNGLLGPNTPEAYEVLLADVINGDQITFVRSDEIEQSWKIIQQIIKLPENVRKLYFYKKKSAGPRELDNLDIQNSQKKEIRWRG